MNLLNFINWPDFKCFLIKKLYWIKNNVNHTWISALCVSVCIRARFPAWSSITVINKVVVCQLSRFSLVHLSVTPWAVACQALLSVGILQARILEWVTSRAWAEEPGGLQSIGWQRVGYSWSNLACMHNKHLLGTPCVQKIRSRENFTRCESCHPKLFRGKIQLRCNSSWGLGV